MKREGGTKGKRGGIKTRELTEVWKRREEAVGKEADSGVLPL